MNRSYPETHDNCYFIPGHGFVESKQYINKNKSMKIRPNNITTIQNKNNKPKK